MKVVTSFVFRSICAIVVGFLLVLNPEQMTVVLVQVIGVLFGLSGLFSLLNYVVIRFSRKKEVRPMFPLIGLGSFCFGLLLVIFPGLFIAYLMYMLGALLVFAGISQMVSLIAYRRAMPLHWAPFLVPLLVLIAGIVVLANPFETASLPFMILGICCMGYGLSELINGIRLQRFLNRITPVEAEEIKD